MAALFQGLRASNKEFLQAVHAHQAHLSEAWERISQRPRGAAGRDETQRVPRLLGNWAHAGDPAAAPGAPDAFQPGMEFLQATLPQQKQACSATEQERAAALFKELQSRNNEFLAELIAQQAQQTEAWQKEAEVQKKRWNDLDQAFEEGIARLEQRATCKAPPCAQGGRLASSSGDHYESPRDNHATNVTQGELLKGSWV